MIQQTTQQGFERPSEPDLADKQQDEHQDQDGTTQEDQSDDGNLLSMCARWGLRPIRRKSFGHVTCQSNRNWREKAENRARAKLTAAAHSILARFRPKFRRCRTSLSKTRSHSALPQRDIQRRF